MASPPLYCTICGTANQAEAAFCFACGQALHSAAPLPQPLVGSFHVGAVSQILTHNHLLRQRYRIIERVGKGGFSAVYKAEDIVFHNRPVAVKEMRQGGLTRKGQYPATPSSRQPATAPASNPPTIRHTADYYEYRTNCGDSALYISWPSKPGTGCNLVTRRKMYGLCFS